MLENVSTLLRTVNTCVVLSKMFTSTDNCVVAVEAHSSECECTFCIVSARIRCTV